MARPLEPVERFLSYLASVERSPNTVKAYAHDLKDWFTFLALHGLDWRSASVEDVASFVGWLRLPPAARDGQVSVLPTVEHHCSGASVNRKLVALTSFCGFHARLGVPLATSLVTMTATGRRGSSATSYRPFLQHISKNTPQRRRTIALPAPVPRQVVVMPRRNENGARAKGGRTRTIPASAELMRLYADYLNEEYGALDSDYVFVNLWGSPHGHPLSYPAVYDLVTRLRRSAGPYQPGGVFYVYWQVANYLYGQWHPRGGSQAPTDALERRLIGWGGQTRRADRAAGPARPAAGG